MGTGMHLFLLVLVFPNAVGMECLADRPLRANRIANRVAKKAVVRMMMISTYWPYTAIHCYTV